MNLIRTVAAATALLLTTTAAQATGFGVEGNFARHNGVNGAELGLGYGYDIGPLKLSPIVGGFIYKGDNDRYYNQTFSNGQTVCRDSTNGQFAKAELCDNTAIRAYGKLEGTLGVPGIGRVGGGYRISNSSTPYGTVVISALPVVEIKGSVGDDYYSVGISLGF